ncbi:carbohydrate-binding family 9-like protein [Sphingobacterium sp. SYP-B4668]|uniref:carbohydrate-binding family 9-like protein n=1 Tax=Sphingobacterium sp. SYP-B4668 TaxID=2996035 RepID=UPI0022DD3A44|nr:carbohydrate-binding family 9-like protein [Sphingobacterium sp. SYP-B4668]
MARKDHRKEGMTLLRKKQKLSFWVNLICLLGLHAEAQQLPKKLIVDKLDLHLADPSMIPRVFDETHLEYHQISNVNWPDYPYRPDVKFRIAYSDFGILLHFKVVEQSVRAKTSLDNGPVWEDSCVEFFIQPDSSNDLYYNLEFNCIGKLLIESGTPGNRTFAGPNVLANVKRWSSLGTQPFEERKGPVNWELAAVIPYSTFFKHTIERLDGKVVKANFYKCGDKLAVPHFISWSPIALQEPQFHAPSFFGYLQFGYD